MPELPWRYPDKPTRTYSLGAIREGQYLAQVKRDGWNAVVIKHDGEISVLSRHQKPLEKVTLLESIKSLDLSDGDVLNGEWTSMREADRTEALHLFTWMYSKYEWLGGLGEEERYSRLLDLPQAEGIFVLEAVTDGYGDLYRSTVGDWTTEGIVLKHRSAKLIGSQTKASKNPMMLKLKWRDGSDGMTEMIVPDEDLVCLT